MLPTSQNFVPIRDHNWKIPVLNGRVFREQVATPILVSTPAQIIAAIKIAD
jgi:hypothetical protein